MVTRAELRQGTRAKVMASAQRLFRERGYKETTVRDIAADAGVSVGSVMAVGDKAHLLVAIFDKSIDEIHTKRKRDGVPNSPPKSGNDPADRLLAVVTPFLAIFAEDTRLSREYSAILTSGDHESVLFSRLADDLIDEFVVVLSDSGVASKDVAAAAKAAYFAYLGVIRASYGRPEGIDSTTFKDLRTVFTYIAPPKGN